MSSKSRRHFPLYTRSSIELKSTHYFKCLMLIFIRLLLPSGCCWTLKTRYFLKNIIRIIVFGIHHNNMDRKWLNVLVHLVTYLLVQYTLYFVLLYWNRRNAWMWYTSCTVFQNCIKQESFLINCNPPKCSCYLVPQHTEHDRPHTVQLHHNTLNTIGHTRYNCTPLAPL
jgi:hypothetical protein